MKKQWSRTRIIQFLEEIRSSGSTEIMGAVVKKRSTGELRTINFAFNLHNYDVGGLPAYNPEEKKLFWVYDVAILRKNKRENTKEKPQRSIAWEGIISISVRGDVIEVID